MTQLDRWFVALAIVEGLSLVGMGVAAFMMLETLKRAQTRAQPAIREVQALTERGKAMAEHAKQDGQGAVRRVKELSGRIQERVAHTRRVVEDLKPHQEQTLATVRDAAAEVADKTQKLSEIAGRLARVKVAAEAAAEAARSSNGASAAG